MEFSEKLKELRQQKGVSQTKLAADIHISRSAVAKWENGLGLPSEDSLLLLSEYFGVDVKTLLADKKNEETLIAKNKTIDQQKKVIIGFAIGCGIGLLILGYVFIEPLRDCILLLGLGALLTVLGIFNMKGNVASIHWYQRRRVSKEDQKPYCRLMGLGTLICGGAIFASGILQMFALIEVSAFFMGLGVLIGFSLMIYAQFKYNKGIF